MSLATFGIWIDSKLMKTNCQVLFRSHLATWPKLNICKRVYKPNAPSSHIGARFLTCSIICFIWIFAATWITTRFVVNFLPHFQICLISCICEYFEANFFHCIFRSMSAWPLQVFVVSFLNDFSGLWTTITYLVTFHQVSLSCNG